MENHTWPDENHPALVFREKIQKSNMKKPMKKYIGFQEPLLLHAG